MDILPLMPQLGKRLFILSILIWKALTGDPEFDAELEQLQAGQAMELIGGPPGRNLTDYYAW